jgi:hypothetical protein
MEALLWETSFALLIKAFRYDVLPDKLLNLTLAAFLLAIRVLR